MASELIPPRVLKGFRDILPRSEQIRRQITRTLEDVFTKFGFVPIDTPALEYTEILLGKGGGETDKQVYRFEDHGGRDVSLRFDLTVPFARYMAQHRQELYLPFKRYHMGKVWRGENTQRGRYREFVQCDFDIVGVDSISADVEILIMMRKSLESVGLDDFLIHVSNRRLFNRFLTHHGLNEKLPDILRIIDKIQKIGADKVSEILQEIISPDSAARVISFVTARGDWLQKLESCEELSGGPGEESEYLRNLYGILSDLGISEGFIFDPTITRGLDYYTGIVFETFLNTVPNIGSVCSGGRYNNLASLYTKEDLPGVGASIGLDRLLDAFNAAGIVPEGGGSTEVLVFCLDGGLIAHYHGLAQTLRNRGISCEVYPLQKKFAQQFQFAEKKNISFALICGEEEYRNKTVNLKELKTRLSHDDITLEAAVQLIHADKK